MEPAVCDNVLVSGSATPPPQSAGLSKVGTLLPPSRVPFIGLWPDVSAGRQTLSSSFFSQADILFLALSVLGSFNAQLKAERTKHPRNRFKPRVAFSAERFVQALARQPGLARNLAHPTSFGCHSNRLRSSFDIASRQCFREIGDVFVADQPISTNTPARLHLLTCHLISIPVVASRGCSLQGTQRGMLKGQLGKRERWRQLVKLLQTPSQCARPNSAGAFFLPGLVQPRDTLGRGTLSGRRGEADVSIGVVQVRGSPPASVFGLAGGKMSLGMMWPRIGVYSDRCPDAGTSE